MSNLAAYPGHKGVESALKLPDAVGEAVSKILQDLGLGGGNEVSLLGECGKFPLEDSQPQVAVSRFDAADQSRLQMRPQARLHF